VSGTVPGEQRRLSTGSARSKDAARICRVPQPLKKERIELKLRFLAQIVHLSSIWRSQAEAAELI